jgi:hypothetical protein
MRSRTIVEQRRGHTVFKRMLEILQPASRPRKDEFRHFKRHGLTPAEWTEQLAAESQARRARQEAA